MAFLPPYLLNAWRLEHGDEERAKAADELKGWTPSSLAEFHFKAQLDRYYGVSKHETGSLPSLSSIAVGKVLDVLRSSEDLTTDAKTIADNLSSTTLRQLLRDPRTPYQVLRVFNTLSQTIAGKGRRVVDVDEAVIQNERYIRSRGRQNLDGKYLVSLEDLCSIVSDKAMTSKPTEVTRSTDKKPLAFARKDPPKGGLEVLDHWRPKQLSINSSDAVFSQVFDRITNGILRGLDWTNIMLAGGMALTTLLHVDPQKDKIPSIQDPDLDLYIYGLGPEEANIKAEKIHDTWVKNLPPSATERLVVKNAKTINLLTRYPNRRIQIVLKLLPTPTDVLLNFDLDACAIGFDGSQVFMLPRCARAIETGFSTFSMDLVWGHHLGDRRASQDSRVFKYADRGFGIRFLPSYARSLEEDGLEAANFKLSQSPTAANEVGENNRRYEYYYRWSQRNRKPYGQEPGLKTLKRIAYLGQDYVHRFYFGATPLVISPKQMRKQLKAEDLVDSDDPDESDEDDEIWRVSYEEAKRDLNELNEANALRRAKHEGLEGPLMRLADLDTEDLHHGLPDGRRGLGNLEIFMRHCEAWRLHSCADATLDMTHTASLVYDPDTYDDVPTYDWNKRFSPEQFSRIIKVYNDSLWQTVKEAICGKLGIVPARMGGYADYSTRRIRRQVCGPDFKSVQEKQITIPVNVPFGLENYLLSTIPQEYDDLPSHFTGFKPLIPVHDATKYDPSTATIPSLHDTASETGNLRYWVITNESMWACQHRVLDEFAELMWTLFHWFNQAMSASSMAGAGTLGDTSTCCWKLARSFRRRIVLPEVPDNGASFVAMKPGLPSLRETLLFRPWAFSSPAKPDREFVDSNDERHELFDEEAVLYPFPDELFWDSSDVGTWDDGEGAPEWTVPAVDSVDSEQENGLYSYKN